MIKVEIAVKPIVKIYLENKFKSSEIPLKCDTPIGKYFYSLLKDACTLYGKKQKYKQSCVFLIQERVIFRKGSIIDDNGVIQFNTFIEDLAKEAFFDEIEKNLEGGILEIREAIYKAQEKFNFDEQTYSYAAIKQAFYRKRKSTEIKK